MTDLLCAMAGTGGDLAGHVARRLSLDGSEFELVLAGGMFRSRSRIMRAALEATVKRSARFAFAVTLEAPPVEGAVLLALEEAAATVDAECHARLAVASIEGLNRRRPATPRRAAINRTRRWAPPSARASST